MKTITGKLKLIFDKVQRTSTAQTQRFGVEVGDKIIYINAFNNCHLLEKFKRDDEVIVDYNEKETVKDGKTYINNYLVCIANTQSSKEQKMVDEHVRMQRIMEERKAIENRLDQIEFKIYSAIVDEWMKSGRKVALLTSRIKYYLGFFKEESISKWDEYSVRVLNKIRLELSTEKV